MSNIEGQEIPSEFDEEMHRMHTLTDSNKAALNAALTWYADQMSILRQENDVLWGKLQDHFSVPEEDYGKWYARVDRDTGKYIMRERGSDNPLKTRE